jgi:hypothetical protein
MDGGNILASPARVPAARHDRFFYIGMAFLVAAIVFAGFARTYFLKDLFGRPPLPLLLHLHGILFTSWFALFLTQVTLVAVNRTDVHRRLGVVGAVLAAVMIVVGPIVAIHAASRGVVTPGLPPPLVFLVVPLFDILVFAILVAAGLRFRRRSQTHKRLMPLAKIALLPPATARLPFAFILATGPLAFFGLADLVLLACILYDVVTHRRMHPAYLWGGLPIVVSQPLRLVVGSSALGLPSRTG